MNNRMTRAAFALAAAALAASACGKKSETVTMKTSDGKVAVTASDSGVALPAEFPKDVPVMKGAVVKAVMGSAEQGNLIVMASSPAPFAEVVAYYEAGLKEQGWTKSSSTNTGEGAIMTLKKDGRDLMLTIAKDGKDTSIQLALPTRKG
ncbi:MAG: hypothetical protein HY079_09285 [Elusimicrobia bacterium]|nr:hypothetical protein [Elusimicrobiota bacterium]